MKHSRKSKIVLLIVLSLVFVLRLYGCTDLFKDITVYRYMKTANEEVFEHDNAIGYYHTFESQKENPRYEWIFRKRPFSYPSGFLLDYMKGLYFENQAEERGDYVNGAFVRESSAFEFSQLMMYLAKCTILYDAPDYLTTEQYEQFMADYKRIEKKTPPTISFLQMRRLRLQSLIRSGPMLVCLLIIS